MPDLESSKKLLHQGKIREAFDILRQIARPEHDYTLQHKYQRLLDKMPEDQLNLTPIKIAILASSSVEHLMGVLRFWMAVEGFKVEIYLAEFNTIDQSILDSSSELYQFKPDIVWIFTNYRDIRLDFLPTTCAEEIEEVLNSQVQSVTHRWEALQARLSAYIIQNNADLPLERPLGNFESTATWGTINALRKFNTKLSQTDKNGVTIFDLEYLSSLYGKHQWFNESYWFHSKHAFSLNALGIVNFHAARMIAAIKGKSKKCLVLDLDNTLWGGVIGDDGLDGIRLGFAADGEAFVAFQKYLKELKTRGVILTVCSKNEEQNAKLAFEKHPDMQLRLEDIAVFVANWNNKADNIKVIAETLNLGLDSFVFIDDNPAERELVRSFLPQVAVLEMPQDPAEYVRALDQQRYFETIAFSSEDAGRNAMYRENAQRKILENECADLSDYLKRLEMKAQCGSFDQVHMPRIAQLINKSNQFHLTTTRYTESQIKEMAEDPNIFCQYFKLKDIFGDNGLISAVILKSQGKVLLVDTWVMSCRVLSRGMEEFVHNEIVAMAKQAGCEKIRGKYIPTTKNALVAGHYPKLGYRLVNDNTEGKCFELALNEDHLIKQVFISKENT